MDDEKFTNLNIVGVRYNDTGLVIDIYKFLYILKAHNVPTDNDALTIISGLNADPVYYSDPPQVGPDQLTEWDGAVEIDGKWYRKWKIVDAPNRQSEIIAQKWADVRRDRNTLLSGSDWTQGMDSPLSADMRQRWALYRQQLRDITKQDISAIVWPEPPTS